MSKRAVYIGNTEVKSGNEVVKGEFVEIGNEKYYKISNCNQMPDFFMTIVSDSDHWMFISSNGSLSAGRKNRDNALFPYYTVDKIHDSKDITGSKSYFLVEKENRSFLWEPFTAESQKLYAIERNLYKSIYGNKIIFEEINSDLGISFQYGWYNSEKFGLIKRSTIHNITGEAIKIEMIDGIRNILPSGIDFEFQNTFSNLLDAYKKSELLDDTRLGLFVLSSIPVDRAEPSEALKASTVWSFGMEKELKILISDTQVKQFTKGLPVEAEFDIRAHRGAYYINASFELKEKASREWMFVVEINQDTTQVANLNLMLKTKKNMFQIVDADIEQGTQNLKSIVSKADGLQMTHEDLCYARHFSNTLFNVMRGGIFTNNYLIDGEDFRLYVSQSSKLVAEKHHILLSLLPVKINHTALEQLAEKSGDPDLIRISHEYLPLTFSRRHGDPSRPWNLFAIETKNEDGSVKLNYQGNWRDIFQNWEALCFSYPGFIEGIISKFVNATTADGYNPYRISRQGIDWECPDPHDPWAYIGYWGDHQIIYLQKFLELSNEFHPGKLDDMLVKEVFAYANVPYRIKSYEEIVRNPQDTIVFDFALNDQVKALTKQIGADGSLLRSQSDDIYRVNLTEKILVTLLAKLSNFIPEAGIWLNTQRPEWNDANNALVGNGVSMVTLYYLRRFLKFWTEKFEVSSNPEIAISAEVKALFDTIFRHLTENKSLLKSGFSNTDRRRFADELGRAGSAYRNELYKNAFTGKKAIVKLEDLLAFTKLGLDYMDQSIAANKREDGLYHAYNLISFSDQSVSIRHLYEMLEGQVAVLSSGYLSVDESLNVLNSLKQSKMYRSDQNSYMLYPDRQLPRFTQKNNIPSEKVNSSKLLSRLLADKETSILSADSSGKCHFNGKFRNASVLEKALSQLDQVKYAGLVQEERDRILGIYEELFDHQSFTGRSGTFYGYEGLGSIYWHMVSKLLLAAQEVYFRGIKEGVNAVVLGQIKDHYNEIKAGIGLYKSPDLHGAFPTDAYSHTPSHAGAQQPGMTGQVKEDFLARMAELGVQVNDGKITFDTSLIDNHEFLTKKCDFEYFDLDGDKRLMDLNKGQLAFTFCQVPVVYTALSEDRICITLNNGKQISIAGNSIDQVLSTKIFERNGEISLLEVSSPNFKI